ncbi:hypothetical protein EJ08DRAFT_733504 [Tothia fuscella]|uniref:Uncharacterized protein n=1 Tax=Tothia fuscella TaxID=1048955 RepID=A0A9P4NT96_9PEZI|nr:hypothetical protein EJ08DRAFT_733504 [Tothia fuscella]
MSYNTEQEIMPSWGTTITDRFVGETATADVDVVEGNMAQIYGNNTPIDNDTTAQSSAVYATMEAAFARVSMEKDFFQQECARLATELDLYRKDAARDKAEIQLLRELKDSMTEQLTHKRKLEQATIGRTKKINSNRAGPSGTNALVRQQSSMPCRSITVDGASYEYVLSTGPGTLSFPEQLEDIKDAFDQVGINSCYHTLNDAEKRRSDYTRFTRILRLQPWEVIPLKFLPIRFGYYYMRHLSVLADRLKNARPDPKEALRRLLITKITSRGLKSHFPLRDCDMRALVEEVKAQSVAGGEPEDMDMDDVGEEIGASEDGSD